MESETSPLLPASSPPQSPRRPSLPRLQTSPRVQWRVPPPPPTPPPPRPRIRSLDLVPPLAQCQQLNGNVGAWRVTIYHADCEHVCLRGIQSTPSFAFSHQSNYVCRRTPSPSHYPNPLMMVDHIPYIPLMRGIFHLHIQSPTAETMSPNNPSSRSGIGLQFRRRAPFKPSNSLPWRPPAHRSILIY